MTNTVLPKQKLSLFIGLSIIIFGICLSASWNAIYTEILAKGLILTETSESFKIWRDTPIDMYMNFYFFNWTNPNISLSNEKPILEELGPYHFRITERKVNLTWNKNGTVTYRISRKWFFQEENSNGSLDDIITTLNVIAITASHSLRGGYSVLLKGLSATIAGTGSKLYIQQRVGDLLFDGYTDNLLNIAKQLPSFANVDIPFDKFGWFYKRNDSSDFEGTFNMDTGATDLLNLGELRNWNFNSVTNFYQGVCSEVRGSAGELFSPAQTQTKSIEMYSADLCRSISLNFEKEVEVEGIQALKFVAGVDVVDNGTYNEQNSCYCNGECSPVGVINVTSCRFGAPGFVSFPQFYLADSYYHDNLIGMKKPDPDKHSLYITLEPVTGIPLDVAARFQINILIERNKHISILSDVPKLFFPMVWFEQRAMISPNLAAQLRLLLSLDCIGLTASILTIIIGFFIIFITTIYIKVCGNKFNSKFEDETFNDENELTEKSIMNNTEKSEMELIPTEITKLSENNMNR